jgi:hypothetical protein
MQTNSEKLLNFMRENRERKNNHFHDEDFCSFGFPPEYLERYLDELEQAGFHLCESSVGYNVILTSLTLL